MALIEHFEDVHSIEGSEEYSPLDLLIFIPERFLHRLGHMQVLIRVPPANTTIIDAVEVVL